MNANGTQCQILLQNENTWASFHRRVSGIAFNYEELFSDAVFKFLEAKAKSVANR